MRILILGVKTAVFTTVMTAVCIDSRNDNYLLESRQDGRLHDRNDGRLYRWL